MEPVAHPALTLSLALATGVVAQSLARHLRVPGIVLLLLAGTALGPDGLGWVQPRDLGIGLLAAVDLAVAVILFEGGLNLELRRLRREQSAIQRLVTWGVLVTIAGAAVAAQAFLGWSWMQAVLFGGLVAVTGPTVVTPLVASLRLRTRAATVLEAEGVLVDPVGAIIAVLLLEIALSPDVDSVASAAAVLLYRSSFGAVAGVAAGFALAGLLRIRRLVPEGYENIFVLSFVLLVFQLCDAVLSHSGLLAVTVAGVVVGNLRTRVDRDLREFKDQLTVLLIGLLFVLLAADVRLADVAALGWSGFGVVMALVFLVRPLQVALATIGTELSWRERALLSWIAPRGIVAAAVSSVTASALDIAGLPGGTELRAMVFLTIAVTVVLAGLTAAPVAQFLGQRLPTRDAVVILGAQGLGITLARELEACGRSVTFVDSNPESCRLAQEAGYPVVYGNALQERTLLRARIGNAGTVIGLTTNQMLNAVFVSRARERFGVKRAYVAASNPDIGLAQELVREEEVAVLFDAPHDVERWDVRMRNGDVDVSHWLYGGEPPQQEAEEAGNGDAAPPARRGDPCVMVAVRRGKACFPMNGDAPLQKGDVVTLAIHRPEREEALRRLAELGFREAEQEPEGEAVAAAAGATEVTA